MELPNISSKLPDVATSIFTVMSGLAAQHQAVNLGQGFPDYDMDPRLQDLVYESMRTGYNQYAHANGDPFLREVLAQKIHSLYGNSLSSDLNITITPGGTYALFNAMAALLQPGDEVVVPVPCYDSYIPAIQLFGAVPRLVPLQIEEEKIPWASIEAAINSKTKFLLLNFPHNPSGMILGEEDIAELRRLTERYSFFILSDEVYEHLVYDNKRHLSILKYPDLFARAMVCFSFGKVFHCTGWKLGYCVAPAPLMKEFRKVHQFNVFSCFSPAQHAIAIYLQNPEVYTSIPSLLAPKRDLMRAGMADLGFQRVDSSGSYFECYSYQYVEALTGRDPFAAAVWLVENAGVASIPVSAFYPLGSMENVPPLLRFCFAKKEGTLREALHRLSTALATPASL